MVLIRSTQISPFLVGLVFEVESIPVSLVSDDNAKQLLLLRLFLSPVIPVPENTMSVWTTQQIPPSLLKVTCLKPINVFMNRDLCHYFFNAIQSRETLELGAI